MRVLEICTSKSLGGLELYFVSCCSKFSTSKETELLGYVANKSLIHRQLADTSVKYEIENASHFFQRLIGLLQLIRNYKPELIHSHVKTDLLVIALCKILSRQRFKHIHTRQMNFPRKKKNPFHGFIYNQIDLILAITEKLKKQIIENTTVNPSKVQVLYYGVPTPISGPNRIIGLDRDSNFKIGVVARIDRKKNQHVLLDALKILRNKNLTPSAYLIGRSTDEYYAKELEKNIFINELSDHVKMVGFLKNPIDLMHHFDVILLTSEDETFGLVLAEAMRAGVAVIGANGGGVPEIIIDQETGLLFEPNNPESLARAIKMVISDKQLHKTLAKNGKKKADQIFNEVRHFSDLNKIFTDLLNNS